MMLQNQLDKTNDVLDQILQSLEGLKVDTPTAKQQARPTLFEFVMNSSSGQDTYQTSGSLIIVRLMFASNTSFPYAFQIGTDRSRRFKCGTGQYIVVVRPNAPVFVGRGMPMTFVQIGGTGAVWDAWGWAIPADSPGQVNVRQ